MKNCSIFTDKNFIFSLLRKPTLFFCFLFLLFMWKYNIYFVKIYLIILDDIWEGMRHDTILCSLRFFWGKKKYQNIFQNGISHVAKSYANCTERNRLFIERTHLFGDRLMYLSYRHITSSALISSFQPFFNSVILPTCCFYK